MFTAKLQFDWDMHELFMLITYVAVVFCYFLFVFLCLPGFVYLLLC